MNQNKHFYLHQLGLVCALGCGQAEVRAALFGPAPSGVAELEGVLPGRRLHLGAVRADLPDLAGLPERHRSRNNALLLEALAQIRPAVDAAVARYGAERVAVILGTSTSGIGESEAAFKARAAQGEFPAGFDLRQQEIGSPALMLAELLGLGGPAYVISTACSSSAKAMASAARLLASGMCDAVLTGGADSLCAFTVAGFDALESVDAGRCNPFSSHRQGINIGEAAALFLMSREPSDASAESPAPVRLAGWGESSDAHHISAPLASGEGAFSAMQMALTRAGLRPEDIDYLNLHGTATRQNDAMESRAVQQLFGPNLACSSTKPLTGHTLGAAGALEAAIAWLTLTDNPQGLLPPHWWDGCADPELPALHLVRPGEALGRPVRAVLSNSFAFGGSNAALLLCAGDHE
ncbi:beta-ketoacyl-ACP synthase [Paucibacter sp. AS339]|uniref:beta-ketoacyl-ACP synthase n=1 Tax=Paucibacter hankyongi TaxID=3133434 RepID=UPI0030A4C816